MFQVGDIVSRKYSTVNRAWRHITEQKNLSPLCMLTVEYVSGEYLLFKEVEGVYFVHNFELGAYPIGARVELVAQFKAGQFGHVVGYVKFDQGRLGSYKITLDSGLTHKVCCRNVQSR